ncbi:PREDICTED: histone H3.v1 [Tarenaya hassleriana]|uniref:Mental retardation GTPase activating protein n=1 Tax=Tarenaya spinosa TaxID=228870 RepID=Q1KUN0_9ROSI|nr:PREDICTED: histone H3.v1 [Tarenaya hassleriana]ABD96956.1 hypothetical protein [Tarenaya spinosa]
MALRGDEPDFNLREWDRRARITRENPSSRRFSASYIRSFREDIRSSRTYFAISSTASSPGYPLKEEIDPSTYSFTSALKALQAKTVYNNWDWLTPEGFALNSKWDEAEKYICNPLSGEVPMECLSSKTLSARSFRNLTTMSAPLIYPSQPRPLGQNKPVSTVKVIHEDHNTDPVPIRENKGLGSKRDVGVQSTPADPSSGSPSPAQTPPIVERSLKRHVEAEDSPVESALKLKDQHEEDVNLEEEEEERESKEKQEEREEEKKERRRVGCLGWMRKRQRKKHHSKKSNIFPIFVPQSCQRLLNCQNK